MSKYEAITEWIDELVRSTDNEEMTKGFASINSLDGEDVGTYGVFTDVYVSSIDDYIDGTSVKACDITLRLVLPFSNGRSKGSNNTNFDSQGFAETLMTKIRRAELEENYPKLGDNMEVTQIENLDNDPVLEDISEDSTKAIYSVQLRIEYLDSTNTI